MVIRNAEGYPEMIFIERSNKAMHHTIAEWLEGKLAITFTIRLCEEAGSCSWSFPFLDVILELHFDPGTGTVSVRPTAPHPALSDCETAMSAFYTALKEGK